MSKPKNLYVCERDLASESVTRWATTPEDGYAHYRLVTPPKPKREAIAYVIWLDGRGYVHTSQHTTRLLSLAQRFVTRQEADTAALSWSDARVFKLVRKAGAK